MSKLSEALNNRGKDVERDDLAEQIDGYFEDVMFNLESLEQLPSVPSKLKSRFRKIRKEMMNLQGDLQKELD